MFQGNFFSLSLTLSCSILNLCLHYGSKWEKNLEKIAIIHFPTSVGESKVSAAERASEVSEEEQANEGAVRANERTYK